MNMKTTWPKLKALTLTAFSVVACTAPGFAQPTITVQPASQTILTGSNVIFSVMVDGTGSFTYQWQFNGTNLPNNIITTFAGNGNTGFGGDGGPATNAAMFATEGLALDQGGNLFFADTDRIRKVDTNGIITTVVGGPFGYAGDGGPATNALLHEPSGVAMDRSGNLYIADSYNCRIRKVDTNGIITTVRGNGSRGFSGDGGSATNASLNFPQDVAVDPLGNFYIADLSNQRIRKVDTQGFITTVAGNGVAGFSGDGGPATNAHLNGTYGVTVSASGSLYIGDHSNSRVRMVDTNGIITTVAGGGSGGDGGACH
jgi:trimeric autotransporter adhesin